MFAHIRAKYRNGKMNYDTKDRRYSSQRDGGEADLRTVSQVVLPELYNLGWPRDKHLQGQERKQLFSCLFPFGFEDPKPDSCSTEPWVEDREETQDKNMNNANPSKPLEHFPRLSLEAGNCW